MSILILCIVSVFTTVLILKLSKISKLYVPLITAITINFFWQIGNYLYIGYLDPFWKMAVIVGFLLAISVSLITIFFINTIKK